jgi:anion-transporting  ArsA/GET3 family ATPase
VSSQAAHRAAATLAQRLSQSRVCICVGAGGVGKTSISAALALGLALEGKRVAVVTIDPAKRLATALGLRELPGDPHRISEELLSRHGLQAKGQLWAMMLDVKGTFDALIGLLAPDERTRRDILENRIYQELSSAVAGSQEFTAIAKLHELSAAGAFDTIVLDTPPSRNALDFLDAPARLTHFLEGRALRVLMAPGGRAVRVLGRGTSLMMALLARVSGIDLIGEISGFFNALGGLLDGFRERARSAERLLRDPDTTFLIVTSPSREACGETEFLHSKLLHAGMPFGGLIVNRVHLHSLDGCTPQELHAMLEPELGERLASRATENLRDFDVLARRDREGIERLRETLGEPEPVIVPELGEDIQDLGGLASLAELLLAAPAGQD